ncbi:MAG: hypothetical protein KFF73_08160 [Cyclobacteriaceae bacterium]|nr:hypothetical protein [Cyclobacteriaceae bacterium]
MKIFKKILLPFPMFFFFISFYSLTIAQGLHGFSGETYGIRVYISCADGGEGEFVEGEVTAFIIEHSQRELPAREYTLRVAGTLNGVTTGTKYHTQDFWRDIKIYEDHSFNSSYVEKLQFVGGGIVFRMMVVYHLTSKGGNVLVEFEHSMEDCLGKKINR